jgi:NhaP-type Na+/H+ or K+/H+ antiporter
LLRDIGASKRLATLIEAESLLNDGTAYVIFLIFRDEQIEGRQRSLIQMTTYFARLSIGGVALGLAVAIPVVTWLRHVFNDAAVETTITLGAAYLTFWMAESEHTNFQVSSVLAVVTMALYLSKNKTCISPGIEEALHHVWELVAYAANTLIFFISGIIVSFKVFGSKGTIEGRDYGYCILLYIMLHFIRGFTVLVLSPLMRTMGYGLTKASGSVLVYAGLRGAVGLALGLLVELETDIPEQTRDRVVFHVAGICMLTLTVNGTTTGWLLRKVGLAKSSKAGERVFEKAISHLVNETAMLISSLKHHKHYTGANWQDIKNLLPEYDVPLAENERERLKEAMDIEKKARDARRKRRAKQRRRLGGRRMSAESSLHSRDTSRDTSRTSVGVGGDAKHGRQSWWQRRWNALRGRNGGGSGGDGGGGGGGGGGDGVSQPRSSPSTTTGSMNTSTECGVTPALNAFAGNAAAFSLDDDSLSDSDDENKTPEQLKAERRRASLADAANKLRDEEEMKLEITHRFLSAMKAGYLHQFEEGMTTRAAVSVLIEAAETAFDVDDLNDMQTQWQVGSTSSLLSIITFLAFATKP